MRVVVALTGPPGAVCRTPALGLNVRLESAYPPAMARYSRTSPWAGLFWGARAPQPALLVFTLACSGMLAEPAPQVETAALHDSAGDPVIATLHTKDSELRITSSGGSLRYSLLDAEGVSKSLTLEQLQSYDPNLYEFVKHATARRGMPVLDARVVPSPVTSGGEPSPVVE